MAIVNVWYPTLKSRRAIKRDGMGLSSLEQAAYSFVENVGHASLTLDRTRPEAYVSWWPNDDHTGFTTPNFAEDTALEGAVPTVRVRLDCLDEDGIRLWWDRLTQDGYAFPFKGDFLPADNKWNLDVNNCSHIVWLALKIGGAERYAKLVRLGAEIVTPPQIHAYALQVKAAAGIAGLF